MKNQHQQRMVDYYDSFSKKTYVMSESERQKMQFFSYRVFFPIALAIVMFALTPIQPWLILTINLVIIVVLQFAYMRFRSKTTFILSDTKRNPQQQVRKKSDLFRSLIYFFIGIALIITNFITSQGTLGVNEVAIYLIALLAVYTGYMTLNQYRGGGQR